MSGKQGNSGNEDIKAKMREALDRKKPHDEVEGRGHDKEKGSGPETHGPMGGMHLHRRKAGGGGS